ncbi:MAG: hypothetical protein ACK5MP_07760 [Nostocoides sp.]
MSGKPIVPQDEYMHQPTDHPQFNESAYYNLVDHDSGFAVLIRMGNRVNERHAEVTVLVYLPGGRAAIRFDRAPIATNNAFDAAGLKFEIIEPLQTMRVTFNGTGYLLAHGTDLEDPKSAFTSSPLVPLNLDLRYQNTVPVFGLGDGSGIEGTAGVVADGHYQGPCHVSGSVQVGDEEFSFEDVTGYRDHSWGPRIWQGPAFWRWLTGLTDDDWGILGWIQRIGDTRPPGHGMIMRDGVIEKVNKVDVHTEYGPAPYYPEKISMQLTTESGEIVDAVGTPYHIVPLRHRRDDSVARVAEYLVKWEFLGRTGYGFCEYQDLIVDGIPAGMSEA